MDSDAESINSSGPVLEGPEPAQIVGSDVNHIHTSFGDANWPALRRSQGRFLIYQCMTSGMIYNYDSSKGTHDKIPPTFERTYAWTQEDPRSPFCPSKFLRYLDGKEWEDRLSDLCDIHVPKHFLDVPAFEAARKLGPRSEPQFVRDELYDLTKCHNEGNKDALGTWSREAQLKFNPTTYRTETEFDISVTTSRDNLRDLLTEGEFGRLPVPFDMEEHRRKLAQQWGDSTIDHSGKITIHTGP